MDKPSSAKIFINGTQYLAHTDMSVAAAMLNFNEMKTRKSVAGQFRFALCGMGVCHECRVRINGRAHQLACQVFCRPGMVIQTEGEY